MELGVGRFQMAVTSDSASTTLARLRALSRPAGEGKARPGLKVSNPLPGCAAGRSAGLRSTKTSHLQSRGAWLRCSRRKSFEPGLTQGKAPCIQRRGRKTFLDDARVRQPVPQQAGDEIEVFVPAGHKFGNGQVMDFQAESRAAAGVFVSHWHEAFAPAGGQNRCVRPDTVGVVTEGLMKGRAFADGAIDQIAVGRVAQGEKIGFDGDEQFGGRMRKLAEHGLAADDDEFLRARDAGRGADDVLKLRSLHGVRGGRL